MAISSSPATGARGQISIGDQVTFNAAAAPTHKLDFTSESLGATEETIQSEAIRSDRGIHKLVRGALDVQGDINYEQSASGFGVLIRHALGDYIRLTSTDGGLHARLGNQDVQTLAAGDNANDGKQIVLLTDDTSVEFPQASDLKVVYRDSDRVLQEAALAYEGYTSYARSYVTAVVASDTTYTGYASVPAVSVVVAPLDLAGGGTENLTFNPSGGVIDFGPSRTQVRYFEAVDLGAGNGTRIFLDPVQVDPGTPADHPSVDDILIRKACITDGGGSTYNSLPYKAGFIYHTSTDYTDTNGNVVYTHHLERGRKLPVAGLTVEIDRDAAVFTYIGNKINTATWNFETNAIVTGSFSLVGQRELAMATLSDDVVPGATEIFVDDKYEALFPASGQITLGERTGITYTTKEVDHLGSSKTRLSGIPATGDAAIDRPHVKGENVDCRSSNLVSGFIESLSDPLTSFESMVYIDGYFEEVLSGSITLNNNLNTDKFGLGSRNRLQIVEEDAVVEASLNMEFDDGKFYTKFKEGTYFALEFKCISEADESEIGNTGVLEQGYYLVPKCKFSGNTPFIEGKSYITHDMPMQCIVDDENDTTDLVIILVNGEGKEVDFSL